LSKYTLIVTEKPDAANRIANALDQTGKAKRMQENGVPYYEAQNKTPIIVVSALGHLYTISSPGGRGYPVFKYEWVPRYKAERGASRIRVWLQTIKQTGKRRRRVHRRMRLRRRRQHNRLLYPQIRLRRQRKRRQTHEILNFNRRRTPKILC